MLDVLVGVPRGEERDFERFVDSVIKADVDKEVPTGDDYIVVDGKDLLASRKYLENYKWYRVYLHVAQTEDLVGFLTATYDERYCFVQVMQ